MSRVRNALEFLQRYHEARDRYDRIHRPRIEAARSRYDGSSYTSEEDDLLEAQVREFFVDALLTALNWQLDVDLENGLPNLIPEAQLRSNKTGTRRFLDYFGLSASKDDPLLVVETKRPNSLLPRKKQPSGKRSMRNVPEESVPSILSAGLNGTSLTEDWNEWLDTLRDYVRSVFEQSNHVPKRVVITSGYWLIVFVDPADSFLPNGTCRADSIVVFRMEHGAWAEYDEITSRYTEIFSLLEHQLVLNESPALTVGEIAFHIQALEVKKAMHGLRLLYIEEPDFFAPAPVIKVMPVVLLQSRYGAWLQVESRTPHPLPYKKEDLPQHLLTIRTVAESLLREINIRLGTTLTASSIETHYRDEIEFEILRGVQRKRTASPNHEEYLLITGQHSHYFHLEPTVSDCEHHNWAFSHQNGCASPQLVPIVTRSTEPRSFLLRRRSPLHAQRR